MIDDFLLRRLGPPLTEEEALDTNQDILPKLHKRQKLLAFRQSSLIARISQIQELLSRHLGIPQSGFILLRPEQWIAGSFNICLPIEIQSAYHERLPKAAILRIALPSEAGEDFCPDIVDEKLRCEAATYVWLSRNCPTVPIPRLLGMGFPEPQSFTAVQNQTLWNHLRFVVRRGLAWLQGNTLPPFFSHRREALTDLGYLVLEYVTDGKILSRTWNMHRHDERRRANLFLGLAKIFLDLARVPLPRIGSFTMDDRGVVSLTIGHWGT